MRWKYSSPLNLGLDEDRLAATLLVSIFSVLRNLFVPPRSRRSAFQIHLPRLNAMAESKAVTAVS